MILYKVNTPLKYYKLLSKDIIEREVRIKYCTKIILTGFCKSTCCILDKTGLTTQVRCQVKKLRENVNQLPFTPYMD